jgi:hypothetical protein
VDRWTREAAFKKTIVLKGKEVSIVEAIGVLHSLPYTQRQKIHTAIHEKLRSISFFAESELNAIGTYKKLIDSKRSLFIHIVIPC